jgi:hypothetical protein
MRVIDFFFLKNKIFQKASKITLCGFLFLNVEVSYKFRILNANSVKSGFFPKKKIINVKKAI